MQKEDTMNKRSKLFGVPILLIIFRRKEEASKVISAISKVKPARLYISQDGPRNEEERKEILATRRAVISKINWKCKLTVWTHQNNLGLKKHIPEAFDRFFEKEKYGIYLEDDTLPSKEFFYFQQDLLKRYERDNRIFSVNGTHFFSKVDRPDDSYYLTEIGDIWGFGLWKRSWKLYSPHMTDINEVSKSQAYRLYFFNSAYRYYLESFWRAILSEKLDSWAMQLIYAAVRNNMYFISPVSNMVNNIGINKSASNISLQSYQAPFSDPFPLKHPRQLVYKSSYDIEYFRNMLKGGWVRLGLIRLYLISPKAIRGIMTGLAKIFSGIQYV